MQITRRRGFAILFIRNPLLTPPQRTATSHRVGKGCVILRLLQKLNHNNLEDKPFKSQNLYIVASGSAYILS